ncbi:MAG TPA: YfhO family protein [Candidatus Eisenbacteria bacterium]
MKRAGFTWRWAYALVAVLVLVFFYPLVLGKVFVSPDSVAPAGFAKIAMEALRARHVYALWNPYHFLGMPTFGSLAFVPYVYPPDPVFGFLNATLHFPDLTWLLAHYLLLALAMVALLRALGAGPETAALGGVTLALTPNLVAVGAFGHGSQIMTAAYLPLLLLLFDRFARRGSLVALAGFALAAAFQLLRGHVQIVFYSWLALGGYALFLAVDAARAGRRDGAARALVGLLIGLGLGFGMSAFLYLPVHEYAKLSTRSAGEGSGAGFDYATSWSFHPLETLTFVIPSMFGFGGRTYWGTMPFTDYPNYMGIVPLALAVVGAVRSRGLTRSYLLALTGAALLVSFGKYLRPLYALLYDHLPYFNKFRVPVMILVLVQFATAALAVLGLEVALRRPASEAKGAKGAKGGDPGAAWMRGAILAGLGAVAAVVVLQLLAPALTRAAEHARSWMNAASARQALDLATLDAVKSGLFLAAAWAVIAAYRRGRLTRLAAALLVLGLTALDLWMVDRKIMDPQIASAREYADNFTETPEIAYLRSDTTQYRVLPLRWDDSRLAAFGIASVLGYHPAKPRLYQAFMDTVGIPNLGIIRLLNVKYVLTDGYYPDTTSGVALRHDGPVKVYEVKGALPRAFVVHRLFLAANASNALAVLRSSLTLDPRAEAVWEGMPPTPGLEPATLPDSVTTLRYDFNESDYMVSSNARGLLVQVDEYDPDWTVTIDGTKATIHRVNYLMRGVIVPPGVHRVRFRYEPRALEAGIRISIASVIVTLLIAGAGAIRRRRGAAAALPEPAAR